MAYRLKSGESLAAGVKRIAREELGEAIECLRNNEGASAVHEVRKHLKKVRALLRLMKSELGDSYDAENVRLRDIGKALSPVRDAEALVEAVDRVKDRRPVLAALRSGLVRNRQSVVKQAQIGDAAPKLAKTLEAIKREVRTWPLNGGGPEVLEPGLKSVFLKGKKALKRYQKTGLREDLHEWRKRVKDHWYHVRLLEDLSEDGIKEYERLLKELEDALGEDLNLSLLEAQARKQTSVKAKRAVLSGAADGNGSGLIHEITAEQKELRKRALKIGKSVYTEKARSVVKRLVV